MDKNCFLCGSTESVQKNSSKLNAYEVECPVCGYYEISQLAVGTSLISEFADRKHLLSALTRQKYDAGGFLTITTENISTLLNSIPNLSSPLENLNKALLFVGQKQKRADQSIEVETGTDYPLVFVHDRNEFEYLLETLAAQGFLENIGAGMGGNIGTFRLTPNGWERVLELQKTQLQSDQAFVAMWFSDDLKDAFENGFHPALTATGFHPYKADQNAHNQKIDDRIVAEIRRSGLLVADFTGHRGGVYFEAGFALGLGIPVIWTCKETDIGNVHFDTRQYNHIVWKDPNDLKSKLILRIEATIPGRTRPEN